MRHPVRGILALIAGAVSLTAGAWGQDRTAIICARAVAPDGTLSDLGAVVIAGGKVERLAKADEIKEQAGLKIVRHEGAVICPGLIDLCSAIGEFQNNLERAKAVDPSVSAIDAVDPGDPALGRALRAGITAVMITPQPSNVISGVAATVRTWTAGPRVDALRTDGPLVFALGTSVFSTDREPTSRPGALVLLRGALAAARDGKGAARVAQVLAGKLDAIVICEATEDVDGALRTFGEFKLAPHIVHTADAVELAPDLAERGPSRPATIVGPYTFTSSPRTLEGAGALERAGADVAFTGGTPLGEAAGLRVTAALAVRYGMDAAAARRGLTVGAARVAGVEGRVGSLKPGMDADIVVFSGDPLRLESRVIEVYVNGVRVYTAPPPVGQDESGGSYE